MPRYLDEEELELEKPQRDKELTLGTGMLIAIPVGLVLLCAVCFGLGYFVGHRSSGPTAPPVVQTPAPDQEPLAASGAIPKPSAAAEVPVPASAPDSDAAQAGDGDGGAAPPAGAAAGAPASPAAAPVQVRPALGGGMPAAALPSTAQPAGVRAALPGSPTFMVQVASLMNAEDASVLTNALRSRGYPVATKREPADGMIHVRVGPFASHDEASRWRDKLLGDGYNAMVQP